MHPNSKSDRSGKAVQSKNSAAVNSPNQIGTMRAVNMGGGSLNIDQIFNATHRAVRESIEETFGKTMHDFVSEADDGQPEPFETKNKA